MASYHPPAHGRKTTKNDLAWQFIVSAIKRGWGEYNWLRGFDNAADAERMRLALYAARNHFNISVSVRTFHAGEQIETEHLQSIATGKAEVPSPGEHFDLRFQVFERNEGRRHQVREHGTDVTKWHYNPYAKKIAPTIDQIRGTNT